MGQVLKLSNFLKVFPACIISAAMFFATVWFLYKGNGDPTDQIISVVATIVCLLLFIATYAFQNRLIADYLVARFNEEEPPEYKDVLDEAKGAFIPTALILLVMCLMYNLIIPMIGSMAGEIFQVDIGFEFNILTLIINLSCITWMFLAIASVNTIGAGFLDTFSFVFGFVFSHFAKVVAFIVTVAFSMFVMQFVIVSVASGNQLFMMPLKALVLAYIFGLTNTYAAYLVVNNVTEEDLAEDEEDE